jgi:hypothetical protein
VKVRFDKIGYPLYCDVGPCEGDMRIELTIILYLSQEEHARYEGSESLQVTLGESGGGRLPAGGTTGPSGELPAGWTPVSGGPSEVRTNEHGTRPLPACSRLPRTADRTAISGPDQGAT